MLFWIVDRLWAARPGLVLQGLDHVALRALLAAGFSLLLTLLCGSRVIDLLRRRFREPIKCASAEVSRLHQAKAATPTMGGLLILAALLAACLLLADLTRPLVLVALAVALALAAVGACDDWIKLSTTARGLSPRAKFAAQTVIGLAAALAAYRVHAAQPGALDWSLGWGTVDLGWWFVPLATLVIVGSSNAVNLADGLDGLAAGCLVCAALVMSVAAHSSPGASELAVIGAALVGALIGFLWFNCHPASIFMGDVGSLPLGGLLGVLAVAARHELLLLIVAGVFVVETASVIVQVGSYRLRKRRVLLCAPLHHHFQLLGWPEDKIVVRFWIAGALCAAAGLAVLGQGSGGTSASVSATKQDSAPAKLAANE